MITWNLTIGSIVPENSHLLEVIENHIDFPHRPLAEDESSRYEVSIPIHRILLSRFGDGVGGWAVSSSPDSPLTDFAIQHSPGGKRSEFTSFSSIGIRHSPRRLLFRRSSV
jgi:hypothetical protein